MEKIIEAVARLLRELAVKNEWRNGDCIIIQRTADGAAISHDKSNREKS